MSESVIHRWKYVITDDTSSQVGADEDYNTNDTRSLNQPTPNPIRYRSCI